MTRLQIIMDSANAVQTITPAADNSSVTSLPPSVSDGLTPATFLQKAEGSTAANHTWTIITDPNTQLSQGQILLYPMNEIAFKPPSGKNFTQSQLQSIRYVYSGPNANQDSFAIQLGSAPNAMTNGRLIMAHIPPIFTQAEILKMTPQDLSQFPCVYHTLRGANTVFQTKWCLNAPWMFAYNKESYNGTIAITWAEVNFEDKKTSASVVVWVSLADQQYAFPRGIKQFESLTYSESRTRFKLQQGPLLAAGILQETLEYVLDTDNLSKDQLVSKLEKIISLL